jgi:putative transposase
MRVRAYRFRAYSSKTTARVLNTQLEVACKLYNTLLHAEQEEYEKNKHTMSRNELRQLALDLRKQNPEFQALHSQVAQQVADRFYRARQRFLEGLANKPKEKKPHRFLSLVYPQSGWRLSNTRDVGQGKNKKKRKTRLYLSKIGFFTLILHRELPENQVSQVCVKLYPSGRVHVIFLVEEPESQERSSEEPKRAVGVDLGLTRLATLSDGRFLDNPKPLERSLERIRVLQRTLSRKRFLSNNWLKAERRLAKEHEHVGDFRRDVFFKLGVLLAGEYDVLVLEDLNVEGLVQKGETKKRRRLRLHDSSFSELKRILEWQFLKRGKLALTVPSYNTSRECFKCGEINENLTVKDRVFLCPHCGFTVDRDLNASLVLLKRAGWVPPAAPVELRPIPPLPSLGLGRQGGAMRQEAPAFRRG